MSYAGAQSGKNRLFLGVLPPKERFPVKYIAVVSTVPSVLHPGACILAVGKQGPPIFALYWDKKLQFSLQVSNACIASCYELTSNTFEPSLLFNPHSNTYHSVHCEQAGYQPTVIFSCWFANSYGFVREERHFGIPSCFCAIKLRSGMEVLLGACIQALQL